MRERNDVSTAYDSEVAYLYSQLKGGDDIPGLTSMLPPTLASRGGSGLSLSFLSPFLLGLREFTAKIGEVGVTRYIVMDTVPAVSAGSSGYVTL